MTSREQRILEALYSRLKGNPLGPIPKPPGLGVDRCRLVEVQSPQMPHLSLYPLEAVTTRKGYLAETTLTLKIALWVKGTASEPVDQTLDALWLWVHQQVMTDGSLGGLAISIAPTQRVWGFALHQKPFGDLDLHYLITFKHHAENPSLP